MAGIDDNVEAHTAVVLDPNLAPFFVENFNDTAISAFNRIVDSSVPFGDRLPGAGPNAFGQLQSLW